MTGKNGSTLKVELVPVRWLHGPLTQSIFVEELSILISSALSTKLITERGSLLVRLANGWVCDGAAGGVAKISVILSCQIDPVGAVKADAVRKIL